MGGLVAFLPVVRFFLLRFSIVVVDMATNFSGSTSEFARVGSGVVLKYPRAVPQETRAYEDIAKNFVVEIQILKLLQHPRIVKLVFRCWRRFTPIDDLHRYLGENKPQGDPRGILLAEANRGDLQRYLDEHWNDITPWVRKSWCLQVVESVAYIHARGVIHSDIRPENFLVHEKKPGDPELWLCDFGGSTCDKLGLDGGHLPDPGFFDPRSDWTSTPNTDIFSVGSVLYSILTGHWPYREAGPFASAEERDDYGVKVDELFGQGQFPDVDELFAGKVILKCWNNEYTTAEDLVVDVRNCMQDS